MTDDNNNEQNPFEQIFGMLFGANGPGSGQGDDKNSSACRRASRSIRR